MRWLRSRQRSPAGRWAKADHPVNICKQIKDTSEYFWQEDPGGKCTFAQGAATAVATAVFRQQVRNLKDTLSVRQFVLGLRRTPAGAASALLRGVQLWPHCPGRQLRLAGLLHLRVLLTLRDRAPWLRILGNVRLLRTSRIGSQGTCCLSTSTFCALLSIHILPVQVWLVLALLADDGGIGAGGGLAQHLIGLVDAATRDPAGESRPLMLLHVIQNRRTCIWKEVSLAVIWHSICSAWCNRPRATS